MKLPSRRELVALLLYYSGIVHLASLARRLLDLGGPVFLTGHRVIPAEAARGDPIDRMALLSRHAITPEELEHRLKFLQRWIGPCGDPDELSVGMPSGRAFYLTFDDGYLDNLNHAAPVLRRHGVWAVIFIVSDLAAHPCANPWWDRWGDDALKATSNVEDALREYGRRCNEAKRHFAGLTIDDLSKGGTRRYLTLSEIWTLPAQFFVANHTQSHSNLCTLSNDQIANQVVAGDYPIVSHPRRLPIFAFPFGIYDARVVSIVQANMNCSIIFATGGGEERNPSYARRINLNTESFPMFAAQCAGLLR